MRDLPEKPRDLDEYYFGDDDTGRVCLICDNSKAIPGQGVQVSPSTETILP